MRITVLTVPDCPNAPVIGERIARAVDGRSQDVELVEAADQEQAARLGMTGSPTVLIDGADPFAVPGAPASLSCHLYRGADGRVEGAPSVADLRRALDAADTTRDCECPPLDAAGRGERGRLTSVAGGLRAVQQEVLRHFAATGGAPSVDDLESAAAAYGRGAAEVLADLANEDFVTLDDHGRIRGAYPFSTVPTAHRVRLATGVEVWAMCAVDALGIPDMLRTDAVITSADPVTGETITVTAAGGPMTWQPSTAVVFIGRRSGNGIGVRHRTRWGAGMMSGMRIRIDAIDLPGLAWPAHQGPAAAAYRNIHVAVQRRDRPGELLDPQRGDAASAAWTLECTTVASPTGLDVKGRYVQGRPGGRFVYLSWGTVDEAGGFTMFRRAKLMLDAVPAEVLGAAARDGLLVGRLGLTDACGGPLCARVVPPRIAWTAEPGDGTSGAVGPASHQRDREQR